MNILVTGGGGFLGGAIVRQLIARGHAVTALGRGTYPRLAESGIQTFQADIRDRDAVYAACAGRDAVIHTAAIAGIWGGEKLFWDINHQGTLNVLAACRDAGVRCLVHTSSPSVVFGAEELCGVNESHPYPPRHLAPYPASKAAAEQAVLRGNSPSLRTVALRPHLIFGPGDPHLFPRIIARARARKLVQVGHGTNLVDVTYIDNAALAHVLALDNLASSASAAGRAFFISQGEPVNLWSWLRDILARLELPPPRGPLSARAAALLGAIMESAYKALHLKSEPRLTRFLALQLATSHYFDISAARRDLGYQPLVPLTQATDCLVADLRKNLRHHGHHPPSVP